LHNSDFGPSEPIASVSTSVLNGNGLVVAGGPSDAWERSRQSIRMCAPDYGTRRGPLFEPGRCCHRGPGYENGWPLQANRKSDPLFSTPYQWPERTHRGGGADDKQGSCPTWDDYGRGGQSFLVDKKSRCKAGRSTILGSWRVSGDHLHNWAGIIPPNVRLGRPWESYPFRTSRQL
jgi:hypothetical protein